MWKMFAMWTLAAVAAPALSASDDACAIPLHAGVRISGNDIAPKQNATSASECCSLCAGHTGCRAFLYVGSGANICWLKSEPGRSTPCKNCVAGTQSLPPPPPPSPRPPPPPPPPAPGCQVDADCNGCGACITSACECEKGWTGEHCELLHLGPAYDCDTGSLCLNNSAATGTGGYTDHFTSTWGGEVVESDDHKFHIFAASFGNNDALGSWLENSRVVHGVADFPKGPYVLADVALGPRSGAWDGLTQHNPAVQRDPVSGTYLIYYMGSTDNGTAPTGGGQCADDPEHKSLCNQRVGMAYSATPSGPWTRLDAPIVDAGPAGAWDDQFTCNPTPHVFANGSVLLLYKGRSKEDFGTMSTGVAFAEHWKGPYRRVGTQPIDVSGGCEDAGIYRSKGSGIFHIILHCGCSYQAMWSADGSDWKRTTAPQPFCSVTLSNGAPLTLHTRQRPKWLLNATSGEVTHLLTGAGGPGIHGDKTFTLVQELL